MDKDQFWQIIDSAVQSSPAGDRDMRRRIVVETLRQKPVTDILDWHLIFCEYSHAAYRNGLWNASALIGAHDTDDGFTDFRSWLISRGKGVYMNALRDPASVTEIPLNGEKPNFELFRYAASAAYDAKLLPKRSAGLCKMYGELERHTLDQQTIADIWSEIPQGLIIGQEPKTIQELLESENIAYGYVCGDGQRTEYAFHKTPENIARFLGSRPYASEIIVTDDMDRFILNTIGNFIDRCPDQDLLEEIKKVLIPIQLGEAEAQPFFCPTMEEVDNYCDPSLEREAKTDQTLL